MPNKKFDPKLLWMQFEDVLAPQLGLTIKERCVYSYLLRHSLLVGNSRVHFSVSALGRNLGMSSGLTRHALRRLEALGALRVRKRGKTGHVVEMRVPEKVRAIRADKNGEAEKRQKALAAEREATDFWKNSSLRKAIHDREGGRCFYCLRRMVANVRCVDHVVPRVRHGRNSYRNLVSSCIECNSLKCDLPAPDFLRGLYRKGRLTAVELDGRLQALKDLAAGKFRPKLPSA
ncbi:MAG TPA: HNH endonuclease signature motif containing protein [Candidatus Acidoferrum sp.]|nr:HNH endonuclease signature motif containing protein [Candidatus Acidoferrum sp.]